MAGLAPPPAEGTPRGWLDQLPGARGCVAALPGFMGVPRLCRKALIKYVGPMALSPDGRHLYTANGHVEARTGSLTAFARNRESGALRFLGPRPGCLANARRTDYLRSCATARIGEPEDVVVSPEGRHVYAAGGDSDVEVASLVRDAGTGRLGQLDGAAGCVGDSAQPVSGCAPGYGLPSAEQLEMSPDGRHLYSIAEGAALAIYARDPASGVLGALPGAQGCLTPAGGSDESLTACSTARGIDGPSDVVVSPDGRHVYVAASERGQVVGFARDPASGTLSHVGAAHAPRGDELYQLAASADGATVYATGMLDIYAFSRDRSTGALRLLQTAQPAAPAVGVFDVVPSLDGKNAYAIGGLDGISIYTRSGDGRLRQSRRRRGCLTQTGARYHFDPPGRDCLRRRSLLNPSQLELSRDGRHVYVSGTRVSGGSAGSAISVFRRRAVARRG